MTDPKPPDRTWSEAMDLDAAGRALEALDEPEVEAQPRDADRGTLPSIEGYVLDGRLGGGGGGEVYRAVRIGSDRPLAIKILNQRIGETPEARRAWRELDVLEQLRLPCLPRLLDHGMTDGRMFLVMDFIDGHPLIEHCRINDLDRAARVELLAKVADAVQSLHERGVIHRDIKPSNVIIDPNGQPVLIDLGIAALLSRSAAETLTKDGAPIGSPAYMAPEQARGEKQAISTRSDVYSLGATACKVLTGDTPHDMDATLHEAIRRVAQDEPRSPRELDPTLAKPLAAVLAKAAARDPDRRYTSPADFARDLRRCLNREPVEAGGISPWGRAIRWVGRHPVTTTTAACLLIAAISLAATGWIVKWLALQPSRIVISDDRMEARLLSRNDNILHTWIGPFRDREATLAKLVNVPDGPLAVIGFPFDAPDWGGQVCAFDLEQSFDRPIWSRHVEPELAPLDLPDRKIDPSLFEFIRGWVVDCLPASEGPEILTVFKQGPRSQCVLRAYALDGRLLFQACHDGGFNTCHWMAGPGLLVLSGLDERGWDRADDPDMDATYMWIVMALRPTIDVVDRGWLNRAPGGRASALIAWYSAVLWPDRQFWVDNVTLGRPYVNEDPEWLTRVNVNFAPGPPQSLSILIGADGHEILKARVHTDVNQVTTLSPGFRNKPILFSMDPIPAEQAGEAIPVEPAEFSE
jgi:serine/threonine protein kinase